MSETHAHHEVSFYQLGCICTKDSWQCNCLYQGYNSSRSLPKKSTALELQRKKIFLRKKTYSTQQSVPHGQSQPELLTSLQLLPFCCWLFMQNQKTAEGNLSPGACCIDSSINYSCLGIFNEKDFWTEARDVYWYIFVHIFQEGVC